MEARNAIHKTFIMTFYNYTVAIGTYLKQGKRIELYVDIVSSRHIFYVLWWNWFYSFFLKFNRADRYGALLQTSILYDDFIDLGTWYTSVPGKERASLPLHKIFHWLITTASSRRCISPSRMFRAVIIWNPLMDVLSLSLSLSPGSRLNLLRLPHKVLGHSLVPRPLLCHRGGELASRIRSFISRPLGKQPPLQDQSLAFCLHVLFVSCCGV